MKKLLLELIDTDIIMRVTYVAKDIVVHLQNPLTRAYCRPKVRFEKGMSDDQVYDQFLRKAVETVKSE